MEYESIPEYASHPKVHFRSGAWAAMLDHRYWMMRARVK